MKTILKKYEDKLISQNLCDPGAPLFMALDEDFISNKNDPHEQDLHAIASTLNINSILWSVPKEPYHSIIEWLIKHKHEDQKIIPQDCETRTFIHDLPISSSTDTAELVSLLKKRRSLIIPSQGIVTYGTVSPEQAYITFSSVCFACFIKFFSDYLYDLKAKKVTKEQTEILKKGIEATLLPSMPHLLPSPGPYKNKKEITEAMIMTGKLTVDTSLVDSYFGNISYYDGKTIYISQTGSSLDELSDCIDPCPMDNSSCCGITASSEFSAHKAIYQSQPHQAILHGHPKFSVILSMFCQKRDCNNRGNCHVTCATPRNIEDVPIVPGEVGTGPHGLYRTMPPAIKGKRGAIVYGHGVFTAAEDFFLAYKQLYEIEQLCQQKYLDYLS